MASRQLPRFHKERMENEIIKKRDKQFQHDTLWNGQKKYYENWEKKNTKYEEWSSPRYHETHSKLLENIKRERQRGENIEKRRDKLRNLFLEEDKLYQIELMINKTKKSSFTRTPRNDEIPVDVLRELNKGFKLEEDDRRRHEAELKLYHQWRGNNPIVKHYERMQRSRDLKLSWLDQQIENRISREKEEVECKKILQEREKNILKEQARFEEEQKLIQVKKDELKRSLDKQMEDFRARTEISEELKRKESEESMKNNELNQLEQQLIDDEKRKMERECALYNLKQYKMRLKKQVDNVQRNLDEDRELVLKLKQLDIAERIKDETKKLQIKEALNQFLELSKQQKDLEKIRQKQMDFLFDSEAKAQYEQQDQLWKQEEMARSNLLKDVLKTIQQQINSNLERNREKQREVLQDREVMMKNIEEYNQEIIRLNEQQERRKSEYKKMIDDELKLKGIKKKVRENAETKRIDEELERVRKEEERLKQEIINIQRRQGPYRPIRSKLFF